MNAALNHKFSLSDILLDDFKFLKNEYNQEIKADKTKILYYNNMVCNYFGFEKIQNFLNEDSPNEVLSNKHFEFPNERQNTTVPNEIQFIVDLFHRPKNDNPELKTYLHFLWPISDISKLKLRTMDDFREISKMLIHIEKTSLNTFLSNVRNDR